MNTQFLPRCTLSIGVYEIASVAPIGFLKGAAFLVARTFIALVAALIVGSHLWERLQSPFETTAAAILFVPIFIWFGDVMTRNFVRVFTRERKIKAIAEDLKWLQVPHEVAVQLSIHEKYGIELDRIIDSAVRNGELQGHAAGVLINTLWMLKSLEVNGHILTAQDSRSLLAEGARTYCQSQRASALNEK